MTNPWLAIPAEDHEGHMASPEVGQLPGLTSAPDTRTRFKSLEALTPIMNLVSPEEFSRACFENGLREVKQKRIALKQGKELRVGFYRKDRAR